MHERENTKALLGMPAAEFKAQNPEIFGAKTPRQLIRRSFEAAFEKLGSVDWLVNFANANDANGRVFLQALSRLIPTEITGANGAPLSIVVKTYSGTETEIDLNRPIDRFGTPFGVRRAPQVVEDAAEASTDA